MKCSPRLIPQKIHNEISLFSEWERLVTFHKSFSNYIDLMSANFKFMWTELPSPSPSPPHLLLNLYQLSLSLS
eukprot:c23423_g2_i1 orf=3-218(-)